MENTPQEKQERLATRARVAALGPLAAVGAIIALHFLRPGLNPAKYPVSDYAQGHYSAVAEIAFVLIAIGGFALAYALRETARSRVGPWLLRIFGAAFIAVAIFRAPPIGDHSANAKAAGAAHGISALVAFISLMSAMFVYAREFRHSERWRPFARPTLALAIVAFFLFFGAGIVDPDNYGTWERIYLAVLFFWLVFAGLGSIRAQRLLALARRRRLGRRRPDQQGVR
jgi:hypothetical protein